MLLSTSSIHSFNGDPTVRKPCRACMELRKPAVVSNLQYRKGFFCFSCAINSREELLTRLAWNALSNHLDYTQIEEESEEVQWKQDNSYQGLCVKDFIITEIDELWDNWLSVPEVTTLVRDRGFSAKKDGKPHTAKYISEILRQLSVEGKIYRQERDPKTKSYEYTLGEFWK